jgi:hypothetical protein
MRRLFQPVRRSGQTLVRFYQDAVIPMVVSR